MIKNYEQYRSLALRSIKPHDSKDMAVLDWALGLGGESGEVLSVVGIKPALTTRDKAELKMELAKEIGDVIWYGTALAEELDIGEAVAASIKSKGEMKLVSDSAYDKAIRLVLVCSSIQESIKHLILHKEKTAIEQVKVQLEELYEAIVALCWDLDIDIMDCAALNAAKLAHRFNLKDGGKYNTEASEARHKKEVAFEQTATYKRLLSSIAGVSVIIQPDDVEVL